MTRKVFQADFGSRADLMVLSPATNPIHNGGFDIWQRGTSFASVANGAYTADRWVYTKVTTTVVHSILQASDVPAVAALAPRTNYSLHLDVTTADAAVAAADICMLSQGIEGYVWAPFAEKQVTVGFWVKDTITGTHCVVLRSVATDASCVMEYTVNVADTWEYKTVTFPASSSGGVWGSPANVEAWLRFPLICGSSYQTTPGSWQVGDLYGTASMVNSVSSTSNNFKLWGVTMGLGTTVAPFWPRSFGEELALCQRYYQTSYPYGNTVPTATAATLYPTNTNSIPTGQYIVRVPLRPFMRASPTITIYPYTTVTNTGRISNDSGADQGASSGSVAGTTSEGFSVANQSGSTISLSQSLVFFGWQATADL